MAASTWQRSSYCAQGEACIHVAAHDNTINVMESGDPTGATLHTTPAAWAALIRTVKDTAHHD
ncbi:DUF397 domain-containing protein [Streptomyces sp. NRRL S-1824]|uniref:DUF397 domain-containing protein n=1 Tax=Streptomyces sp. NRRL S-1824 TaxID=1463889 RepID=UPI0004CA608B|nr:DUF397 domain-containing protein [Streptomyces sp. NRRL S-1824]